MDIIHMGGRIYDPTLGRFMQADPIVQSPMNSQSYNRFAYVFNNPMTYTDPSGFSAWTKFRDKILRPILQIAITIVSGGAGLAWAIAGGALSGYIATGSLRGAFIGALSGAIFYGAGDIIANNSIKNIFDQGGIGGLADGISSVLSGGKFGNGAVTAAFMTAYNEANHQDFDPQGHKAMGKFFRTLSDAGASIRGSIESGLASIKEFGGGLFTGSKSVFQGDIRAIRYLGRSVGAYGSEEFINANREGHLMDNAILVGIENPEMIEEALSLAVDHEVENANAQNIGHMVGRTVTGVALAPLGLLAGVWDVTSVLNRVELELVNY